jgi:membrane associated rhomboid family serine protease
MLENRDYMRQESFEPRRPVTVMILIANVVAFALQSVVYGYPPRLQAHDHFALSVYGLQTWQIWQLITFQFMHGGLMHLLLNCWAIYVFGRAVEEALGRKNLLVLYFSSGVLGGLLQVLAAIAWPAHFGGAVVGASAGAFGLVAAYAVLYPERPLTLLLFFVLPVTLRSKYLLLGSALIAIFGVLFPDGAVAHAAHLGGMLFGIAYVRYIVHWRWHWPGLRRAPHRTRPRELVGVRFADWRNRGRQQGTGDQDLSTEEFLSREVDPILDKISAHGIQSLTERERKILEAARKKMAKR